MGTLASGSIDLKSLKVAGEANKYITYIDSDNGIRVYDGTLSNGTQINFIKINSNGMEIFKTDGASSNPSAISIAQFGETVRIGEESKAHINITSGGLDVYNNTQLIGHWGYDSNSATTPYFTFGTRATTSSKPGYTAAKGIYSTVLGYNCIANGQYSFAQGYFCEAQATSTHAEGYSNVVAGEYAHAEGHSNFIDGNSHYSHAEGYQNVINGSSSLGINRQGYYAHVGGINNIVNHDGAFVHGQYLRSTTPYQALFGKFNDDADNALLVIGNGTADDARSNLMVVGDNNIRIGNTNNSYMQLDYHSLQMIDKEGDSYFYISDLRDLNGNICEEFNGDGTTRIFIVTYPVSSVAEVLIDDVATTDYTRSSKTFTFTTAPANDAIIVIKYKSTTAGTHTKAFTLGRRSGAVGLYSYAEGLDNAASGSYSHAEGSYTTASGKYSHAEGADTTASGNYSHAEGAETNATNGCSHAEGTETNATDYASHAEGSGTTASGYASHSEGILTFAIGQASHAQNYRTVAKGEHQTAMGCLNITDNSNQYILILGNGKPSTTTPGAVDYYSNALTVDWNGGIQMYLDSNGTSSSAATSGTDMNLFNAIYTLGWYNDVIE